MSNVKMDCIYCSKPIEFEVGIKAKDGSCEMLKVDFHILCGHCGKRVTVPLYLTPIDDKKWKKWEKKTEEEAPSYIR